MALKASLYIYKYKYVCIYVVTEMAAASPSLVICDLFAVNDLTTTSTSPPFLCSS